MQELLLRVGIRETSHDDQSPEGQTRQEQTEQVKAECAFSNQETLLALVRLLDKKGIITKKELEEELKG